MDAVETGAYTRQVPWFGLRDGIVVKEDQEVLTAAEMIEAAGLDWTVEKVPLFANFGEDQVVQVPKKVGLQRSTDGRILGICSPSYEVVTNKDSFDWLDNLVDSGEAKYETAASLDLGGKTMIVASIPKDVSIAGLDEKIVFYLMVTNSYDGTMAFSCDVTPIRAECKNMMRMALRQSVRQWKAKHRTGALDKLNEARNTLGLTFNYIEEYEKAATALAQKKFSTDKFVAMLDAIMPLPADPETRAYRSKEGTRDEILALFQNSPNLENIRGTAWGAYNAVGEWADWSRRVNGKSDLDEEANNALKAETLASRQLFDTAIKDAALDSILTLTGAKW